MLDLLELELEVVVNLQMWLLQPGSGPLQDQYVLSPWTIPPVLEKDFVVVLKQVLTV